MAKRPPRSPQDQSAELAAEAAGVMLSTRTGRRVLLVLIVVAAIGCGGWWLWQHATAQPPAPVASIPTTAQTTLRIVTWNLRQFSPERHVVDLRAISGIILDNHFDLVAIQEVKRAGEEVDRLLNALGPPWRGTHFSPVTGNAERFVYIYRSDTVQEIGSAHFIDSPTASQFARTPFQASFRSGNFDFTLITAHLDWTHTDHRRQEAQALARFAYDLAAHGSEKDVMVLGDFNEEHAHGNLHFFEDQGWERLIHDPTNLSSTEDFDNILIDPRYTREWAGRSGVVRYDTSFADRKTAVEDVSDHRPAYADFVTSLPDDD